MCGIVSLFCKNSILQPGLGAHFSTMLSCMSGRGPDSAGFAIYTDEAPEGCVKFTLQHKDPAYDWQALASRLSTAPGSTADIRVNSSHARLVISGDEKAVRGVLASEFPEVTIMSAGRRMEIMKEVGHPESVIDRFGVRGMGGTHVIGHTRMATESAVTTAGSHPFSTGLDLCLVHNGSLSNHNRLRARLQREGVTFRSDNDSEVAAGYLTWQMAQGRSLSEALEGALSDLDGFYTFAVGTAEGFAVLRDPIACKPAVMAETDDYVAMASEFRSLAALPGIDHARIWEPDPATVYHWSISRN